MLVFFSAELFCLQTLIPVPILPYCIPGIVEYMQQQAGPSSILLEHIEDVKKFTSTRDISVVGYFTEDTGEAGVCQV